MRCGCRATHARRRRLVVSILVDRDTRILVQGITGGQASVDTGRALQYGSTIVAGVTPGRGGESVHGVPVFDTVAAALAHHRSTPRRVHASVGGSRRDNRGDRVRRGAGRGDDRRRFRSTNAHVIIARRARNGVRLVGCNTNGIISPAKAALAGIGGVNPARCTCPAVGICSRSGGMSAELARVLKARDSASRLACRWGATHHRHAHGRTSRNCSSATAHGCDRGVWRAGYR